MRVPLIQLETDPDRLAGMSGVELWYSIDGGETWLNHGFFEGEPRTVSFTAPQDGRYEFVLVPVDRSGRREFTPRADTRPDYRIVLDRAPPAVVVLAPNGGERLAARRPTTIRWRAEDAHLGMAPVSIWVSSDGGATWVPVERNLPNTGSYPWETPSTTASYRIRVTVEDLAGNVGEDISDASFLVDGLPPQVQIHGPGSASSRPVAISYTATDAGGAGVARCTLWITEDGGLTWRRVQDRDGTEPFLLDQVDGTYGLWITAEDTVGNRTPPPASGARPMAQILLDTVDPVVTIAQPRGQAYVGGTEMTILWVAGDANLTARPIRIEFSADGRVWETVADALENSGAYRWRVPRAGTTAARIRITATDVLGRSGSAVSEPFAIDVLVPEAVAISPSRSTRSTTEIRYEIRNAGSSPIERVTLWFKPTSAREWMRYGDDPDRVSPFLFTQSDGAYDIYITAASAAGLESGIVQRDPEPGTAPQLTLDVDSRPPRIVLRSPEGGGFLRAGVVHTIVWDHEDAHPDPAGMRLWYSPDGGRTWNPIGTGLDPTSGRHDWIPPAIAGDAWLIKAECRDAFGNEMTPVVLERSFRVDVDAPRVRLLEYPRRPVGSRTFRVQYDASDPESGIARVEAWIRPAGEPGAFERVVQSSQASGEIEVEAPRDGDFEVLIVARDGVGRPSAEPLAARGDFVVAVDATPPEVEIVQRLDPRGRPLWVNEEYEVEWRATDNRTPSARLAISVQYTIDGGLTWIAAAPRMENTGRFRMDGFLRPGTPARVRIVATDEAGREGRAETGEFDIGVVPPPQIALRDPQAGAAMEVGTERELEWSVDRATADAVVVQWRREDQKDWSGNVAVSRKFSWYAPSEPGVYFLRVRGTDQFGRPVASNEIRVEVRYPPAPAIALSLDPEPPERTVRSGETVILRWRVEGGELTAQTLEARAPGGPWVAQQVMGPQDRTVSYEARGMLGEYSVRIGATDRFGRRVESNVLTFTVAHPPAPAIVLEAIPAAAEYPAGSAIRLRWAAQGGRVSRAALAMHEAGEWKTVRELGDQEMLVSFRLPPLDGAITRLVVMARDAQDRVVMSNELLLRTRILAPPQIRFVSSFQNGDSLSPGARVYVAWRASDERLAETAAVQIRRGGEEWQTVAISSERVIEWTVPERPGEYELRLAATDVLQREVISVETRHFRIVPRKFSFVVELRPAAVRPGDPVRAVWTWPQGVEPPGAVRVEVSPAGLAEWAPWAAEREASGVMFVAPQEPGAYDVRLTAPDVRERQTGNLLYGESNVVRLEVRGRREAPATAFLRLTSFVGGERVVAGTTHVIDFERSAGISTRDVIVEVSAESGAERTWRPVPEERMQRLERWIAWRVPDEPGERYRLRICWRSPDGAVFADQSRADFRVDVPGGEAPPPAPVPVRVRITGAPQGAVKGGDTVTIGWEASPAEARVSLELWAGGERRAVIAENRPAVGAVDWPVPKMDVAECEIRVVARLGSEMRVAASEPFEIRSRPPRVDRERVELEP